MDVTTIARRYLLRRSTLWLIPMLLITAPSAAAETAVQSRLEPALAVAREMPRLHSLLVSHNGELVVERYFNGHGADDLANVKSVSKSVMSALVGIAIDDGQIEGVDQPIADFFPDSAVFENAEDKSAITVGNLLSMQAGLETTSNRNYGAWVLSPNWVEFALNQPLRSRPGTRMHYSTGNTHLLSAIVTQATGQSTLRFARENLSAPLGFRLASWQRDPQGIYFGGNNMALTPRQMLRFGDLYLNNGKAGDRQVISSQWVKRSFEPHARSPRGRGRRYGYGWWIREMAGFKTPYAWGYGGQFILLVPKLDLVIVATSNSNPGPGRRRHTRAMYDLLEDYIVRPMARAMPGS